GSIGSEMMMNYTVMGDAVNLAARLEAANKLYGTRSLIEEATVAKTDGTHQFREIDRLIVVGQTEPQAVFELLGKKGELTSKQDVLLSRYANGLAAYRAQRWDEARGAFAAVLEAAPGDGPATALLKPAPMAWGRRPQAPIGTRHGNSTSDRSRWRRPTRSRRSQMPERLKSAASMAPSLCRRSCIRRSCSVVRLTPR